MSHKDTVMRLGEQIGFGNLMDLARDAWRDVLARDWPGCEGGEFQVGPCVTMTIECGCERGCDWCAGSMWLTKHVKQIKDGKIEVE